MAYTEDELKQFYSGLNPEPEQSGWARAGQHLANSLSNIGQSFVDTGTAVANLGSGPIPFQSPEVPKPYDTGAVGSTGHPYLDIGLGHLAPELVASLVPFAGASKVARAASLGEKFADIAGNLAAGAFTGIKSGPDEAAHQGLLNAGLAALPGGALAKLPYAAGLVGADALYDYAQHQDAASIGEHAALNTAFAYLPNVAHAIFGQAPEGGVSTPTPPKQPFTDFQTTDEGRLLGYPGGGVTPNFVNRGTPSSDVIEGQFREIPTPERGALPWGPEAQVTQLQNSFRDLNSIKSTFLPEPPLQGDVQLHVPGQVEFPPKDDFFRLINPPQAPGDFQVHQGGDIFAEQEINNKRDLDSIKSQLAKPRAKRTKVAAPLAEAETVVETQPQPSVVRVSTPRGAVDATVNSFEDGVFHVTIDDPVYGTRQTSVSEFDQQGNRQVFPKQKMPATPKAGVPFQDVKSLEEPEKVSTGGDFQEGTTQAGGLSDIAKIEEAQSTRSTGMTRRQQPGQYGFANPQVLFPLAGAAAGGTQGDTPEERILNAFKGAAIGFGASKAYGLLNRMNDAFVGAGGERGGIGDLGPIPKKPRLVVPALKFQDGKIYSRPNAVAHWDLINDFPEEETVSAGGPNEPFERGFVRIDNGKWLNRKESDALAMQTSPAYRQYKIDNNIDDSILDSTDLTTINEDPEFKKDKMDRNKGQGGAIDIGKNLNEIKKEEPKDTFKDNIQFSWKENGPKDTTLDDVLPVKGRNELLKDHPYLSDIPIEPKKGLLLNEDAYARYVGTGDGTGTIIVDPSYLEAGNEKDIHEKLSHEIAHAIQDKETAGEGLDPESKPEDTLKSYLDKVNQHLSPESISTPEVQGGMSKSEDTKAAFSNIHLLTTGAGAIFGAEEGYRKSGGDPTKALAGAIMGAGLGFMGYKAMEAVFRINPRIEIEKDLTGFKKEAAGAVEAIMSRPTRDIAGEVVTANPGIMSKFLHGLEYWGQFHMPDSVHNAWTVAHGAGVLAVDTVRKAFKDLGNFVPKQEFVDAAKKFVQGKFLSEADAQQTILRGGGKTDAEWSVMNTKPKDMSKEDWEVARPKGFTRWETGNLSKDANGNVTSDTRKAWWMPEQTKTELIGQEEDAFKNFLGKDGEQYFGFIKAARRSLDNLQNLFAEGLPEGNSLKQLIKNSTGQYITKTFEIDNNKQYWPTEVEIKNAMGDLGKYLGENGKDFNEDYLRNEIVAYLHDRKAGKASQGFLAGNTKIDPTLLKERLDISQSWSELLGEYSDPKEQMMMAISRMMPSAKAGKFISMASKMQIDGLPASMSRDEWLAASNKFHDIVDNLKGRPARTAEQESVLADAQTKITRLNEFKKVEKNLKYGEFSDTLANRFVVDQLNGLDTHMAGMDNPIFRGLSKFNLVSKIAHTAYDNVRTVRNIVTLPMFAWIAKASPEAMRQTFDSIIGKNEVLRQKLIRVGAFGADQAAAELRGNIDNIFNGHYDSTLMQTISNAHNAILDFHQWPDRIVRGAAYLEAESRYSAEMNLPIDHPDVIAKSVQWMDRRTINYENVAPAVRVARNIPFFNLYISYTTEIARITKNMALDAIGKGPTGKVDLQALAQLGVLAGAFEGAQAIAEANLSPKDREDWQRANRQGPDYSRSRYKIPIGKKADGSFNYLDITPLIITDGFNQTFRAMAKGDWKGLEAINPLVGWDKSPAFNILNQFNTNTDMVTHRELRNFQDKAAVLAREISPSWTPGVGYQWNQVASIGTQNIKTGREESWTGALSRALVGVNLSSVNAGAADRSAMAQLKTEIANERAYLGDTLKMKGISKEKQDRAVRVYQEAVQVAIANYITTRNR